MSAQSNTMVPKSTANKSKQMTRLVTLVAIVAVILAQSVIVPTAEARYLPTRSNVDQLKRQEIKEILRLLLDLPEEQREQPTAYNGMGRAMADMYELNAIRGARHSPTSGGDVGVNLVETESRAKREAKAPKILF